MCARRCAHCLGSSPASARQADLPPRQGCAVCVWVSVPAPAPAPAPAPWLQRPAVPGDWEGPGLLPHGAPDGAFLVAGSVRAVFRRGGRRSKAGRTLDRKSELTDSLVHVAIFYIHFKTTLFPTIFNNSTASCHSGCFLKQTRRHLSPVAQRSSLRGLASATDLVTFAQTPGPARGSQPPAPGSVGAWLGRCRHIASGAMSPGVRLASWGCSPRPRWPPRAPLSLAGSPGRAWKRQLSPGAPPRRVLPSRLNCLFPP